MNNLIFFTSTKSSRINKKEKKKGCLRVFFVCFDCNRTCPKGGKFQTKFGSGFVLHQVNLEHFTLHMYILQPCTFEDALIY